MPGVGELTARYPAVSPEPEGWVTQRGWDAYADSTVGVRYLTTGQC